MGNQLIHVTQLICVTTLNQRHVQLVQMKADHYKT